MELFSYVIMLQAARRIKERDGLSEQDCWARVNSQMNNEQRVQQSNVILSTQWQPEVTQKHVSNVL